MAWDPNGAIMRRGSSACALGYVSWQESVLLDFLIRDRASCNSLYPARSNIDPEVGSRTKRTQMSVSN